MKTKTTKASQQRNQRTTTTLVVIRRHRQQGVIKIDVVQEVSGEEECILTIRCGRSVTACEVPNGLGHAKLSVMHVRLALRSTDENKPELYLKTQSVPRSKHTHPRLYKAVS